MKTIIISKANIASANIGKILKKKYPKLDAKILETEKGVLELDSLKKEFEKLKAELIIVASSHKSEAGVPMLNCHTTGNWTSDNSHGGSPKKLSIAPALYLRKGILEFKKLKEKNSKLKDYETGMEVTHHSPTIDFPVVFVEVGSTEKQWTDPAACEAAADVIHKLATEEPENNAESNSTNVASQQVPVAIGFGGGHYCPHFNKRLQEIAFGHLCPKYAADEIGEEMVLQAFNKTTPKPDFALVEWKGLSGEQKKKIVGILDKNKISWKKF